MKTAPPKGVHFDSKENRVSLEEARIYAEQNGPEYDVSRSPVGRWIAEHGASQNNPTPGPEMKDIIQYLAKYAGGYYQCKPG